MSDTIPVLPDPECPPDTAYLLPRVPVTVFYPKAQVAPTWEQELQAILDAYAAAARANFAGVIKL